jgi:hypothetical protein
VISNPVGRTGLADDDADAAESADQTYAPEPAETAAVANA